MLLTYQEKLDIMKEFPTIKLSYEKKIYKNVSHSDFYIIIPKGDKCFAWFRQYKKKFVCMIMILEGRKIIKNIKIYTTCFKEDICIDKGTIIYGTLFALKGCLFFSIEDIFYFIDKDISYSSQFKKISIVYCLLRNYIQQVHITKNNIIFGMPIMESCYEKAKEMFQKALYTPFCLQHRQATKKRPYLNEFVEQKKYSIFSVRCATDTDIYILYCKNDDNSLKRYGVCHIPDINTSKMMNNLFRDIKENNNLDTLEESDDEEDFENVDIAKYVHLDRVYNMLCVYNKKFSRWCPLKIDKEASISKYIKIRQIEKK